MRKRKRLHGRVEMEAAVVEVATVVATAVAEMEVARVVAAMETMVVAAVVTALVKTLVTAGETAAAMVAAAAADTAPHAAASPAACARADRTTSTVEGWQNTVTVARTRTHPQAGQRIELGHATGATTRRHTMVGS